MYLVYHHFSIDGHRYDESRSIGKAAFDHLHEGDKVQGRTSPVLYLTIRFQNEHFTGPPEWSDGPLVIPILSSIAWNAFLIFFYYRYWFIPFRQRRLISHGNVALGRIASGRDQGTSRRKISYSFTTAEGESLVGSQEIEGTCVRAGAPCTVFYDPARPSRNIAYEFSGLTIVE